MLDIGIDKYRGLVYEGNFPYGHAPWPKPIIIPAKIVFESDGNLSGLSSNDHFGCRFREDFFDPSARIRRGRFYFPSTSTSSEWVINQSTSSSSPKSSAEISQATQSLQTFHGRTISPLLKDQKGQPLVLLGIDDRFTIWTIVNIEAIFTGEDLVTLKSRTSMGILPIINTNKIPSEFKSRVLESINMFAEEVHRSAPISVIDRARDAVSQILLAFFEGTEIREPAALALKLEERQFYLAASAVKIVALLHSRAKPIERQRRDLLPIREQDAELAVQCVGTLLCELRWAQW